LVRLSFFSFFHFFPSANQKLARRQLSKSSAVLPDAPPHFTEALKDEGKGSKDDSEIPPKKRRKAKGKKIAVSPTPDKKKKRAKVTPSRTKLSATAPVPRRARKSKSLRDLRVSEIDKDEEKEAEDSNSSEEFEISNKVSKPTLFSLFTFSGFQVKYCTRNVWKR